MKYNSGYSSQSEKEKKLNIIMWNESFRLLRTEKKVRKVNKIIAITAHTKKEVYQFSYGKTYDVKEVLCEQ